MKLPNKNMDLTLCVVGENSSQIITMTILRQSGFPPCSPYHRIQVVLGSPRASPPPCKMPGLCSSGLGFAFVCTKEIKRPLRDDFLTQNTILSAQKAPAGRLSVIPKAKYMTLGRKYEFSSVMTRKC